MIQDPYQVLGISRDATQDEIKKAYRAKAKQYHPDLHPDDPEAAKKMNEINEAYDRLQNPDKYKQNDFSSGESSSSGGYGYAYRTDFDFSDIFGSAFFSDVRPQVEPGDSPEMIKAIRNVNAYPSVSLAILLAIPPEKRDARWYYVAGYAHAIDGDREAAAEYLRRAVSLDPDRPVYRKLLSDLEKSGSGARFRNADGGWTFGGTTLGANGCLSRIIRWGCYILAFRFVLGILERLFSGFIGRG